MSRDRPETIEADLHAYADGRLDAQACAAVETYLADNPAAAEAVAAWQKQNDRLRALYGPAADEPVPPRLAVHRIARQSRNDIARRGRMAAAAILLLAAGAAAGWYGRGTLAPDASTETALAAEAMTAHRLYSSEVVHPVEVRAGEKDHLRTWLSRRLARPLAIPDLAADGLTLVGGRLLPAANGPAAQVMYEDEAGRRVTLYIVPVQDGRETSFRHAALDPFEAFVWSGETIACALVGDLPRDRLLEIATLAYRQLE